MDYETSFLWPEIPSNCDEICCSRWVRTLKTEVQLFDIFIILTHYHTMPDFDALKIAVENIVRKGEIACNKQFFLFLQCFLPYMTLIMTLFPKRLQILT